MKIDAPAGGDEEVEAGLRERDGHAPPKVGKGIAHKSVKKRLNSPRIIHAKFRR
jgi:hypothetical protein